jgi:hypothetical protein
MNARRRSICASDGSDCATLCAPARHGRAQPATITHAASANLFCARIGSPPSPQVTWSADSTVRIAQSASIVSTMPS